MSRPRSMVSSMEKHSNSDKTRGVEIRGTKLRCFLTIATFKILNSFDLFRRHGIIICPFSICIKGIERGRLVEANTMEYVRQHTSIPVPKIYCAFRTKKRLYIAMKYIKGEMICLGWDKRSSESQAKIFAQLNEMFEQLRSIPAPNSGGPRNILGGTLFDIRAHTQLDCMEHEFGPFEIMDDFHLHLRAGWNGCKIGRQSQETQAKFKKLLTLHRNGTWPLRFTHGDLSAYNVLVRGDEVVGIIDWETAGWYPSYYEYTQVIHQLPFGGAGNQIMIQNADKFLEPFPEESEMELLRVRFFSPEYYVWDGHLDPWVEAT